MTSLRGIRSDRLRELAHDAIEQGFAIVQSGSGHPMLVSPEGRRVWFSSSTSSRDFHGLANARAALIRAGYVPPERRGRQSRPASPPPDIEVVRQDDEPITREDQMPSQHPYLETKPKVADRGGYTFVSKGKAVAAEDVFVGGQPFRIRTNADGSLNVTTLRRRGQRGWQRKDGDRAALIRTVAGWVRTVEPWEDPMPDTAYTNGHAAAELGALPASAEAIADALEVEPEPVVEPRSSVVIAAFVDPGDYPIARSLDELERAVEPAILALEAAGKSDAAALVRGELAKTPAELELLALYREVNQRPRLERG